jgi:hypothetical protein
MQVARESDRGVGDIGGLWSPHANAVRSGDVQSMAERIGDCDFGWRSITYPIIAP